MAEPLKVALLGAGIFAKDAYVPLFKCAPDQALGDLYIFWGPWT
jgi:hypothetical protein